MSKCRDPKCNCDSKACALVFFFIMWIVVLGGVFSGVMCGRADAAEPAAVVNPPLKPHYWVERVCRNGMMFVVVVSETGQVDIEADMQPKSGMVPVKAVWCDEETGEVLDK